MAIPGNYTTLRVRWPKTVDGVNLAYDKNGNKIMEETELPVTARPYLEKRNKEIPFQIRMEITELNYTDAPLAAAVVKGVGVDMLKNAPIEESDEVKALKAKIAELEAAAAPKNKGQFKKKEAETIDNL